MRTIYGNGFRRGSFCANGDCVEVAPLDGGMVAVRDSKNLNIPQHVYTRNEWVAFVRAVKAGEFDFGSAPDTTPGLPSA